MVFGGAELGSLTFNSSGFFTGLVGMSKEEIDAFSSLFPQLPRVLEYAWHYFIFRLSPKQ